MVQLYIKIQLINKVTGKFKYKNLKIICIQIPTV